MQSRAEGLVGGDLSAWVKQMGIFNKGGIVIGCGQKARDLLALVNVKAKTMGVFISKAGEKMQRRIEAQDFFDQLRRDLAVGAWKEGFERVAECMHRGFMAGIEQQNAGGDQLGAGEFFAGFLSGDEIGQKIVAWLAAAVGDVAVQESRKVQRCLIGRDFRLIAAIRLIHGHHSVRPAEQI